MHLGRSLSLPTSQRTAKSEPEASTARLTGLTHEHVAQVGADAWQLCDMHTDSARIIITLHATNVSTPATCCRIRKCLQCASKTDFMPRHAPTQPRPPQGDVPEGAAAKILGVCADIADAEAMGEVRSRIEVIWPSSRALARSLVDHWLGSCECMEVWW